MGDELRCLKFSHVIMSNGIIMQIVMICDDDLKYRLYNI